MLLRVKDREISCKIRYKKVKHAYLRLNPNYQLEITLPQNRSINPENLLAEKKNWLIRKVKELESSVKLFGGDTVYYKGQKYRIEVIKDKNERIRISDDSIKVYKFGKKKIENILREFLADETLEYVLKKSEELSSRTNLFPKSVSIKNMKSFGHCTREGKIFFNSKLICLPTRLIDYIVSHELLHLKYFNHSKKFKSEIRKFFPEHKRLERELKKYYW